MAGAGWRSFTAGAVLTAAQVQTYLQDQTVQVHASAAARSSALGTAVSAGMVSYRTDGTALEYYNGSAWTAVDTTGGSGNAIINGAFDIWQRSTSFTMPNNSEQYGAADRFSYYQNGSNAGTNVISRQTFTAGQTLVPGNPDYFHRWTHTTLATSQTVTDVIYKIEDVYSFAGQTVNFSFYQAASTAGLTMTLYATQNFGSGGSTSVDTTVSLGTTTTSFSQKSYSFALPSISGKTVGAGSYVALRVRLSAPTNGLTWDLANLQLETGSTATTFKRNSPNFQAELAACQRYYYRIKATSAYAHFGPVGIAASTSTISFPVVLPVTMRTAPTAIETSGLGASIPGLTTTGISSITLPDASPGVILISATSSGLTQYRPYTLTANNDSTAYLGITAEL